MKKNVLTKILLALVMVMLVFALVACGMFGGDDNKKPNNGDNNKPNEPCTEHVDEDEDGYCDECDEEMPEETPGDEVSLIDSVVDIIKNASGLINTITSIDADSTVGLEAAIGAYYTMGKNEGDLALNLAANVCADAPELSLGFELNDVDYFTLGYADATLYLLEGLNLINSDATSANKIKMDASALEEGVLSAMGVAMQYLEYLGNLDALKNLDFDTLGEEIGGLLGSLESLIVDLLNISSTEDGAKLEVKDTSVQQLLAREDGVLSGILGETYTGVLDTIDNILNTLNIKIGEETLTFDLIMEEYLPSIVIEVGYNNKVIDAINLYIAIATLDLEAGITVDLPVFSTEEEADVSFGSAYKAQDLKINLNAALPQLSGIGYSADANLILHTSDAFAQVGNRMATLVVDTVGKATSPTTCFATFDGQTFYVDFEGLYAAGGWNSVDAGYESKYQFNIPVNIVSIIDLALKSIEYTEPNAGEEASNAASDEASIWSTIYDIVAVGLLGAEPIENATEEDCVKFLYNILGEGKYLTIIKESDTSFAEVLDNIIAAYELGKDALMESLYAESNDDVARAGVQLISVGEDGETINGGLISFLSHFIRIPTITDNGDGSYSIDLETTATLENIDDIVNYIEAAFAQYEGPNGAVINSGIIKKICNDASIKAILANGIYLGVGTNVGDGLQGYIEIASSATEGTQYAVIGAGIAFIEDSSEYTSVAVVPEDLTGISNITRQYETESTNGFQYYVTAALFDIYTRMYMLY